ncbi:MAG: NAD(+) diphosphatase [Noviherbaspirillum sp.]
MLQTPSAFSPLVRPQDHDDPHSFIFRGNELLLRDADFGLPPVDACAALGLAPHAVHAVGLLEDRYYRAAWVERDTEAAPGYSFRKLRSLFGVWDDGMVALAGRAYQVAEWARTHRFCGACGARTEYRQDERCAACPACGMSAYPRISPAMMVLVKKGDAILLARHAATPNNRYSALAGFLEAGESIEEAVHREVMEEVGLKVKDLRYFGSQSWPFPHSLMIAFTAEYAGGEIRPDTSEIAEARWYGPGDALPEYPQGFSIAGKLIRANLPG